MQTGEKREAIMITGKDNEIVKEAARMMESAKYRRERGCFAAEGVRLCCDGALSGADIVCFLYTAYAAEKYPGEYAILRQKAERSEELSGSLFNKLADTKTPQGFFCIFRMPAHKSGAFETEPLKRYAALENIQDPSNLGTILRTAEALGTDGVILSGDCCDVFSPKVVRGSMGAVFRVPVRIEPDFTAFVRRLTQSGIITYASTPRDADDIREVDFSSGGVMLIGNEGNGLKPETIGACSRRVRIEMKGRAESLNAAAAAAILLYKLQG